MSSFQLVCAAPGSLSALLLPPLRVSRGARLGLILLTIFCSPCLVGCNSCSIWQDLLKLCQFTFSDSGCRLLQQSAMFMPTETTIRAQSDKHDHFWEPKEVQVDPLGAKASTLDPPNRGHNRSLIRRTRHRVQHTNAKTICVPMGTTIGPQSDQQKDNPGQLEHNNNDRHKANTSNNAID